MTTEYGLKEPKLATTKKSEATDSSADVLEAILTKLGTMEDRISTMETKSSESPKLFPHIETPVEHDRIPEGVSKIERKF